MLKAVPLLWPVMAAIAVVGLACSSAPEPAGAIAPPPASQPSALTSQPPTPAQFTPSTPAPASPIAANATTAPAPPVAANATTAPAPPAAANATTAPAPLPVRQPAPSAPSPSRVPVGTKVGERVPAFTVTTLDGVRLTNADYQGKPYLLFFFATWWPVCRAELRRLTQLYPEFSAQVDLLVVDMDLGESVGELTRFREQQGYPFGLATTDARTLTAFNEVGRSSKFGIDRNGIITYRAGYSEGSDTEWRTLFQRLAQ